MGEVIRRTKGEKFIGWYVRYRDADGRRKMRATHQPTQALARRYLIEVEARIARGKVGIPEPAPPSPTVAELVERFLREYQRPRIKNIDAYRRTARAALRRVTTLIGQRSVDSLSASDIARLRDSLSRTHAENSLRLSLAMLSTACHWAVSQNLLPHNPLPTVEKPRGTTLPDYLSWQEAVALMEAAEREAAARPDEVAARVLHLAIVTALHCGLRKGELWGLRWCDVDLTRRRLRIAHSYDGTPKSDQARHLPLPSTLVPLLAAWAKDCPTTPEGVVFPRRSRAGRWGMNRSAGDTAGLQRLLTAIGSQPLSRPWHALRHTFASHFIMAGGNILALQKILGHAKIEMTLVYAHLAPDFLEGELERVCFRRSGPR